VVTVATPSQEYQIRSIRYRIESASVPGQVYEVTVTEDGWSCSCKASEFTKTRGKCWHLRAAQAGELPGKPRVRVGVAPSPTPFVRPPLSAAARDAVAALYGAD
jgi:hypothetical protein